jgi:hypothetical protein
MLPGCQELQPPCGTGDKGAAVASEATIHDDMCNDLDHHPRSAKTDAEHSEQTAIYFIEPQSKFISMWTVPANSGGIGQATKSVFDPEKGLQQGACFLGQSAHPFEGWADFS